MLLLETSFHNELIAAIYRPTGSQLSKQEREQVLGLPMKHLSNLSEVGEGCFLAANPDNLGRPHDKLLFLSGNHFWVFVPHNTKDSLEQLVILIITIRVFPGVSIFVGFVFLVPKLSKSISSTFSEVVSSNSTFFFSF